jgi:Carboxypeptidase regulatory-like domain
MSVRWIACCTQSSAEVRRRSPSRLSIVSLVVAALTIGPGDAVAAVGSTGAISGKVTDAVTHAPVTGVEVVVIGLGPSGELRSVGGLPDDANGHYVAAGLAPGDYKVGFNPGPDLNYLSEYYSGRMTRAEANVISVAAGSTTEGIDAHLQPDAGRIAGRVVDASDGAPVEGLVVCASGTREVERCNRTGSNGEYLINGLPTGAYTVVFRSLGPLPGYVTQYYHAKATAAEADDVSVVQGAVTGGVDAMMAKAGAISGRVSSAASRIASFTVCVEGLESVREYKCVGFDQVDAGESNYVIESLAPGSYVVSFEGQLENGTYFRQYYDHAVDPQAAKPVPVGSGEVIHGIDASVGEGGSSEPMIPASVGEGGSSEPMIPASVGEGDSISGTVADWLTGKPLASVNVCAHAIAGGAAIGPDTCAGTDRDGAYTLTKLAPLEYVVRFTTAASGPLGSYLPEYYKDSYSEREATAVQVSDSKTTSGVDMALTRGGAIGGRVRFVEARMSRSPVEVCARMLTVGNDGNTPVCVKARRGGWFTIPRLVPGVYAVSFAWHVRTGGMRTQYYSRHADVEQADLVVVRAAHTVRHIDGMIAGERLKCRATPRSRRLRRVRARRPCLRRSADRRGRAPLTRSRTPA